PSDPAELEGRPEAANLASIYAALAGGTVADVLRQFGGGPFSAFKQALADLAVSVLAPIAAEMRRLLADPGHVDGILREGGAKADAIARRTLADVQQFMGLLKP